MNPYSNLSTRVTPQSEKADPRQVENNAGGWTFTLSPLQHLERFLILGTEGGTYYAGEQKHTAQAFDGVKAAFDAEPIGALELIRSVSLNGRAPKQEPTLVAYAYACAHPETKDRALVMLSDICRTGTHLFTWWGYVNQFRGMGRGLKTAVRRWYQRDPKALAYQLVKYQSRGKVSHKKLLGLTRPRPADDVSRHLFGWSVGKNGTTDPTGTVLDGYLATHAATEGDFATVATAITEYGLTHEMVPSWSLASPIVWTALLPSMGLTALIRNLGRMTANGALALNRWEIVARLATPGEYVKARVHPMAVLLAASTYTTGRGFRGSLSWNPDPWIIDALSDGFQHAFTNIEPTGKRRLIALDVSDSMACQNIVGSNLTPREASAAMALVTLAQDTEVDVMAFSGGFIPVALSPRQRLDDAVRSVSSLPFDRTDCAVPMQWAVHTGRKYDSFEVYTDNETWAGGIHPHQALRQYREQSGIDARLVIVGMTATGFTIADPTDPGMLDVVGFDASAPQVMADFVAGRI